MASYSNLSPVLLAALQMAGSPSITSGYRSPEHNRKVGGAKNSMHVQGGAADIDMTGMSEEERATLVRTLREGGITRFGTYSGSPNMLHVDLSSAQGDFHQMHDRTSRNMAGAPEWFKGLSGEVIPASAVSAPVDAGGATPIIPSSADLPETQTMNETTPPVMSATPLSDKYQESMSYRLASNPWIQIGLSLMSDPTDVGGGISKGLSSANQLQQDLIQRDAFERQTQMQQAKVMGQLAQNRQQQRAAQQISPLDALKQQQAGRRLNLDEQRHQLAREKFESPPQAQERLPADAAMTEYLIKRHGYTPEQALKETLKSKNASAKDVRTQKDAMTVLQRLDTLSQQVKENPATVSPMSQPKLLLGKLLGGLADETNSPKLRTWAEGKLNTTAISEVNMGLASAVTDAAKWIVNKSDPRMSNADVDRAERIMARKGFLTDSATTLQALASLKEIIAPYAASSGNEGTGEGPGSNVPSRKATLPSDQVTPPSSGSASEKPVSFPQEKWDRLQELRRKSGGF